MATLPKGEVSLTLGGTSYTLTLNIGTIMAAEVQAKKVFGEVTTWDQLVEAVTASQLTSAIVLFWAMFQRKHPDVTFERMASLVEAHGLPALMQAFVEAMSATVPDPKDLAELGQGKPTRPRKARAGTGASTNSPPASTSV
jgi:hypothetical protein